MSEQPEQKEPGLKAAASGAIAPSTRMDAATGDIMSFEDREPLGSDSTSEGAASATVSTATLLRSKWLILGVFTLLSGATIPSIWLFVKPTYQATAIVRVSPVVPRIAFEYEENVKTMGSLYTSYLNTQVSIIQSAMVLQRVLDKPEVQATTWYQAHPRTLRTLLGASPPTPLERLGKDLSAAPRPRTQLIDVSMKTLVAKDAGIIVSAVVDEYKKYTDEMLAETDIQRVETLVEEQRVLLIDINGLIEIIFNLSQKLGTPDPDQRRLELATRLHELELEYDRLERERDMTQSELELRSSVANGHEEEGGTLGQEADEPNRRFADDVEWRRLKADLGNVRHELELARQGHGESHPRITRLLASVDHAERDLREREEQLTAQWEGVVHPLGATPDGGIALLDRNTLERLLDRQESDLQRVGKDVDARHAEVLRAGEVAKEIAQYEEDLNHKRGLYQAVRLRLQVLELEAKAPARISVAATPFVPSEPDRDRRFLLTVMALSGALVAGLAVVYLRTTVNPKIADAGDVKYTVRVPFLGQLPRLATTDGRAGGGDPLVAESMRMVRTALLERLGGTDHRVVLITSSSRRVGKTSVSIGLAQSLAHLGRKTLLVEADLRMPSLAERLRLEADMGLAALLGGAVKDSEVILPSEIPKLDVLLAGQRPEDYDPEFLANGVFAAYLARWKKSYDFILLDSPPVLPVADARILAGQADGTILVLRSSHCRRNDVTQTYAHLSAAGGTLLGTVLVGVPNGACYGQNGDYEAYYPQLPSPESKDPS